VSRDTLIALALLTLTHCSSAEPSSPPAETDDADDEMGELDESPAKDASTRDARAPAIDARVMVPELSEDASTPAKDASAPRIDASAPASTFPTVSDVAAAGPYKTKSYSAGGPDGNYTIHQPDPLGANGVKHPLLTWGNGGGTTPGFYSLLPHLASHGFVVIAANTVPSIGAEDALGQDMLKGIDWLIAQNDAGGEYADKLDTAHVAAFGYSMGGLATFTIVGDPRWTTTVHISGGNMGNGAERIGKAHAPMFWSCGETDIAQENCQTDFEAVTTQSVVYGTLLGADHLGILVPPADQKIRAATTAWFRYYLMDDQAWKTTFAGPDCKLCKDSANWAVLKKNYD
jgi:dienelactone hydrolase